MTFYNYQSTPHYHAFYCYQSTPHYHAFYCYQSTPHYHAFYWYQSTPHYHAFYCYQSTPHYHAYYCYQSTSYQISQCQVTSNFFSSIDLTSPSMKSPSIFLFFFLLSFPCFSPPLSSLCPVSFICFIPLHFTSTSFLFSPIYLCVMIFFYPDSFFFTDCSHFFFSQYIIITALFSFLFSPLY